MNTKRKVIFYIGNILIGILTFYLYIYLWVSFSFAERMSLFQVETLITIVLSIVIFFTFNKLLIKNENNKKKYWLKGLFSFIITVIIIALIIGMS